MKIVLNYIASLNGFVLDKGESENIPEGIAIKSRCANSNMPNLIILEVPGDEDLTDEPEIITTQREAKTKKDKV